jgi:Ca2+-binding RTX toxin-like protein
MPVFLTLTAANVFDPAFWSGLNVDTNSTINAAGLDDTIQITLTANSITFTDTVSGTVTTFTDADLGQGSFSNFVAFTGNDADNIIGGSVGLNSGGYTGGSGDDSLTDDGTLGGNLSGGAGDDTLIGGDGSNQISGGIGNDILRGGGGPNNLDGGDGNDTLFADEGAGNLIGGGGDDVIYVGLNTGFVDGGSGNNTMLILEGATFAPFSPGATGGTITIQLPDGGTRTITYLNVPESNISVVICFAAGTRVETPGGPVAVEDLRPGDLVATRDDGPQPLRWIGRRTVPAEGAFAPIRFSPGSIGNHAPLLVSPQHRMLLSGWRCELLFGEPEVLCAACHLVDGDRIHRAPRPFITYVHLMFDKHQIVFAEGAAAESLFIGDYQMDADPGLYTELLAIFPELLDPAHPARQPTHRSLRAFEASALRAARASGSVALDKRPSLIDVGPRASAQSTWPVA